MQTMEQLKQIYSRYDTEIEGAYKKASPLAGIFGMGDDPRNHPCNMAFYENVEQWVNSFLEDGPTADEARDAAMWILEAASLNRQARTYWYFYVAHNHVIPLIPLLTPEDCKKIAAWYDATYPKRERLPNHDALYKKLCKRAKEKR